MGGDHQDTLDPRRPFVDRNAARSFVRRGGLPHAALLSGVSDVVILRSRSRVKLLRNVSSCARSVTGSRSGRSSARPTGVAGGVVVMIQDVARSDRFLRD
jgi:hypothetical protein